MIQEIQNPFALECQIYAEKIDALLKTKNKEAILQVLIEACKIAEKHFEPTYAHLYYCIGTGYQALAGLIDAAIYQSSTRYINDELIESQRNAMYFFYRALELMEQEESYTPEYQAYIRGFIRTTYVNLGNLMNSCGRLPTANHYYMMARAVSPHFGMAIGNIGRNLSNYAFLYPECTNRHELYRYAYRFYDEALSSNSDGLYPETRCEFEKLQSEIINFFGMDFLNKNDNRKSISLGRRRVKAYRLWCLQNRLYLNPLNDILDDHPDAAEDTVQIASIITPVKVKGTDGPQPVKTPFVFEMFNQIKEEYVFARYLVFEHIHQQQRVSYADRYTHIQDPLTYTCYSIRIEKLKTAFRILYSIFDRTAFLLNAYFELGIEEKKVAFFNGPFIEKIKSKEGSNKALCAMHWINRELRTNQDDGVKSSPIAKYADLRNALEHKFVSVQLFPVENEIDMGTDNIRRINESHLQECTFELLYVIREVIIELTLAIETEERHKHELTPDAIYVPMTMTEMPDEYKL